MEPKAKAKRPSTQEKKIPASFLRLSFCLLYVCGLRFVTRTGKKFVAKRSHVSGLWFDNDHKDNDISQQKLHKPLTIWELT